MKIIKIKQTVFLFLFLSASLWADPGEILLPTAKNSRIDIVKMLINDGVNINYQDSKSRKWKI